MEQWYSRSAPDVIKALETSAEKGLSEEEAAKRLQKYGPNKLTEKEAVHWHKMLARQFSNILIIILIVAAIISYALGDVLDALAILMIIILNGLLGFVQEWKAETALKGLKKMLSPTCRVIRDGKPAEIDAAGLAPGDLVLLESGNLVPADIRLTDIVNLRADEALLTGESSPVEKDTHEVPEDTHISGRKSMAWTGTTIVNGRGQGVVVATGMETEFGRIAGLTGQIKETETPLQRQLGVLGKQLAVLAIGIALIITLLGWLWGKPATQMFMAGVSLAVAAVPEGLPAVVTITLALGVSMMARKKALLRHLQAAETLGATSVICTDKTGTLTKNEMTVQKIWLASGVIDVSGTGYQPEGQFSRNGEAIKTPLDNPDLKRLLETGSKCNHSRIVQEEEGWIAIGAPTEAALIVAAQKAGLKAIDYSRIFYEFSFNSNRKRMSVVEKQDGSERMVHIKGAPEVILSRSSKILIDGKETDMNDKWRTEIEKAYQEFSENGLRTLALACKTLHEGKGEPDEKTAEEGITFLGIVGIIDPPRPEVHEALDKTRSAGIKVIMMTGDSPDTALAIARQIGMDVDKAVTGSEIETLSDEEVLALLEKDTIFARTVPNDKFRIVKLLQGQGLLVAMTGDGINDAPALKQADIGIAMGIRGTDVAKGAADMILTDDNFASIVHAIEEGRRQYANIRKFVRYLTSSNIGETLAIFVNILTGLPLILLPIQILWVNLVTDSVTALSLSLEKAPRDIMKEPPRPVTQPILDKTAIITLGCFGSYIGVAALALFWFYMDKSYALANTMAFTGMVMMANIHTLNFRSLHIPMSQIGWFSNKWLLSAIAGMIGLQVCAIYIPVFQAVLNTVPLGWHEWGVIILTAIPLFVVTEIYKTVRFSPHNARQT